MLNHMGVVIPFRPRSGPWSSSEAASLAAIKRELERHGFMIDYAQDSDGDSRPWRAFYCQMTGRVVAVISRSKAGYELLWADRTSVRTETMDGLILAARSWTAPFHARVEMSLRGQSGKVR
jgi:hypothetical protein